nr:hypothetical protein BaRGS_030209 [Batillaria attramentaria]
MSRITALQAKKTDKGAVQCVDVNLLDIHAKDCVGPPDSESFYPTDVCFYVIGGVTVLLVADWLGDSVHVLHVTEERLSFVRHLAADCTELVKPGSLSTDWTGRLWRAVCGSGSNTSSTRGQETQATENGTGRPQSKIGLK